jgi:hypothetical protein
MITTAKRTDTISRAEALDLLRTELIKLTDSDTSLCMAAARRGIFCHGFEALSDTELRDRYSWLVRKRPDIDRSELESLANLWQLAKQEVHELPIACDVQEKLGDSCDGWKGFSNEQLSRFCLELLGRPVVVV